MNEIVFFYSRKNLFNLERRKGGETNGVDFSVPEYLLPNQKDISLTPLFAMNNKNRVNSLYLVEIQSNISFFSLHNVSRYCLTVVGILRMVHENYTV